MRYTTWFKVSKSSLYLLLKSKSVKTSKATSRDWLFRANVKVQHQVRLNKTPIGTSTPLLVQTLCDAECYTWESVLVTNQIDSTFELLDYPTFVLPEIHREKQVLCLVWNVIPCLSLQILVQKLAWMALVNGIAKVKPCLRNRILGKCALSKYFCKLFSLSSLAWLVKSLDG